MSLLQGTLLWNTCMRLRALKPVDGCGTGHTRAVLDVAGAAACPGRVASLAEGGEVRLWDGPEERCLGTAEISGATCLVRSFRVHRLLVSCVPTAGFVCTDCWFRVHRLLVLCAPTAGFVCTDCWFRVYRLLVSCVPTAGFVCTDCSFRVYRLLVLCAPTAGFVCTAYTDVSHTWHAVQACSPDGRQVVVGGLKGNCHVLAVQHDNQLLSQGPLTPAGLQCSDRIDSVVRADSV